MLIHMCLYGRTHLYICTYVRMYVCTYVRMYICTYVRMYVCTYVCMYVCMYVCTYVRMYVCTYVRMCVCTYTLYPILICWLQDIGKLLEEWSRFFAEARTIFIRVPAHGRTSFFTGPLDKGERTLHVQRNLSNPTLNGTYLRIMLD